MKVLNLYAGLGGNRRLWADCEIVAVEKDPRIAAVYQRLHPTDKVIVGDAHEFLQKHYIIFDFIWASPPCQSHSMLVNGHRTKRYPDLSLYQEIIFLKHFCKTSFVVENVVPYYEPLIAGRRMGRHLYWTNLKFADFECAYPPNFANLCNNSDKKIMMDWLDIHFEEDICYGSNYNPVQVLRNCVHPTIGEHIFKSAVAAHKQRQASIANNWEKSLVI